MRRIDARQRLAFSLLEMVLALAIAMMILLALYITLSTQVMHSQAGRETLAEGEVARSILTRIANDIANQLGPVDPRGHPVYETTETPPAESADMTTPAPMPMTTTESGTAVTFNFGVRGDATTLIISSYRVQLPAGVATGSATAAATTAAGTSSDLRQVAFWHVTNGAEAVGLARNEIKQATSADIDTAPTELPEQEKFVFAKEVKSVTFEYFDGSAWQTEWDGSAVAGEDGLSRLGPPAAIRVTITLRKHNDPMVAAVSQDNEQGPTYQHIIALPTSNNFPQPTNP